MAFDIDGTLIEVGDIVELLSVGKQYLVLEIQWKPDPAVSYYDFIVLPLGSQMKIKISPFLVQLRVISKASMNA